MDTDWRAWGPFAWTLYGLGVVYLAGFFAYWGLFRRAAKAAQTGDPSAVTRYNGLMRGFPGAFYAKQFGRRPLEQPGHVGPQA